jgi:hypothetical protein
MKTRTRRFQVETDADADPDRGRVIVVTRHTNEMLSEQWNFTRKEAQNLVKALSAFLATGTPQDIK